VPAFLVTRETGLSPAQAWARLIDWPAHARHVPLTKIEVRTPGPTGVGTRFVARTAVGRFGFDDPMEVVAYEPERFCRIEKRGSAVRGWAELTVEARGAGSVVSWREEAVPARLPRFLHRASDTAGRTLFGRVLRGLLED
jgi:hypothetical protein